MSADTNSVDVLAVLDAFASGASGARFVCGVDEREHVARIHRDAIAARAAIAELIEAASLTRVAVEDDCVPNALIERLTAALSGVQVGAT